MEGKTRLCNSTRSRQLAAHLLGTLGIGKIFRCLTVVIDTLTVWRLSPLGRSQGVLSVREGERGGPEHDCCGELRLMEVLFTTRLMKEEAG